MRTACGVADTGLGPSAQTHFIVIDAGGSSVSHDEQ
jgi:hypothetical protein